MEWLQIIPLPIQFCAWIEGKKTYSRQGIGRKPGRIFIRGTKKKRVDFSNKHHIKNVTIGTQVTFITISIRIVWLKIFKNTIVRHYFSYSAFQPQRNHAFIVCYDINATT